MEVNSSTYQSTTVNTNQSTSAASNKASTGLNKSSNSSSTSTASQTSATAADSYVSSRSINEKGLYSKPKKLSSEQIEALQQAQADSKANLIREMAKALTIGQGGNALASGSSSFSDLLSTLNDFAKKNNLPAIATDPTEAKAAISDGGTYSVDAVATRIMDLATSLAGGDSKKLSTLRNAVEKGFKSAGTIFSKTTGQEKLPSICQDTYKEVMNRFDDLEKKYSSTTSEDNAMKTNTTTSSSESETK